MAGMEQGKSSKGGRMTGRGYWGKERVVGSGVRKHCGAVGEGKDEKRSYDVGSTFLSEWE